MQITVSRLGLRSGLAFAVLVKRPSALASRALLANSYLSSSARRSFTIWRSSLGFRSPFISGATRGAGGQMVHFPQFGPMLKPFLFFLHTQGNC
jgi:hypothetical protein